MKKIAVLLLLCAYPLWSYDVHQEIYKLDTLIAMTEQSLSSEKDIRQLLVDYRIAREAYYQNQNDPELLVDLVKKGHRLNQAIQEQHLVEMFDPDLISELTVLSQVASKKSIPRH